MHPQPKANEEEGEKSEPLLEEKEGEEEGDEAPLPPPALVFLAVSVDASPHMAQAHGPATWPHLRHYWIDAHTIDELGVAFVPNRVVADGREPAAPAVSQSTSTTVGENARRSRSVLGKSTGKDRLRHLSSSSHSRGRVLRWWDGSHGNVLQGPHGKSRANGSHALLNELVDALEAPPS